MHRAGMAERIFMVDQAAICLPRIHGLSCLSWKSTGFVLACVPVRPVLDHEYMLWLIKAYLASIGEDRGSEEFVFCSHCHGLPCRREQLKSFHRAHFDFPQ
jgi:hypothetical protein